ncbi:MAG: hypothetical protein OEW83_16100 [Acidimicrobiia bacterium]|nr:hypothetical protein [Acidimicrobiia bacterium]
MLPIHWPATPSPTLPDREWLRRYFFDLSNPDGIGRFWLKSSGGNLRFVGEVADWIPMGQQPMITSQVSTGRQIEAAYTAA